MASHGFSWLLIGPLFRISYVQSREAFRVAFMAAAAKKVLPAECADWDEVSERAEFVAAPAIDAMGIARLGGSVLLRIRTITHEECPRGFGRRCGTGRLPGGFGAPARERVPAASDPARPTGGRAISGAPASGRASTGRAATPKVRPTSAAAASPVAAPVGQKRRASGAGLPR